MSHHEPVAYNYFLPASIEKAASMKFFIIVLALATTGLAYAGEAPSEEELANATEEVLDVGEEPLELDEMIVTGEQFSLEQETAVRMVRQALTREKSSKSEDRDTWVCWYRKPGGTHFTYMECARNGDLWALRPDGSGHRMVGDDVPPGTVYGTVMRSNRPINKKKFEAMLAQLPGSSDLDKEFVALSLAGQNPPRDIPSDAELDSFASAYSEVGALSRAGESEKAMLEAIESTGLSLDRYNRIVDLVETYQSVENEVAFRLGTLVRPSD